MNAYFKVVCPYCGHVNNRVTGDTKVYPTVIYCCSETGGCDQPFAYGATVNIDVDVNVFALVDVATLDAASAAGGVSNEEEQ